MKEFLSKFGKAMAGITLFLIIVLGTGVLFSYPVMWLWNYVCIDMFQFPKIDFYHAWALMVLCGILFKSPNNGK